MKLFPFLAIILLVDNTLSAQNILIRNVDVIPMTGTLLLRNRDVLISGEHIVSITPHSPSHPTSGYQIIDGEDRYLIPGLAEMHAHIPVPQEGDDSGVKETLFLYLANGITTIRGMLGAPYHLELKNQVEALAFPTPRVYTSSPSLNGNTVATREEARNKVTAYARDGYDFLKIHPGIQRDVFDEVVKTAREVGILFSGHVPADVGIDHAIHSKYASIDHLDGYIEGLAPEEVRQQGGFFGVLLADQADEQRIYTLAENTRKMDIAVVPTQTLMTRWLSPKAPELMVQEREMAYIPASLRFSWRQSKQQMLDRLKYTPEQYDKFIYLRQKLIKALLDNEVSILLGSDAPQVFNVPGFSIHHEMISMADAGMTPLQILESGTVNVARFFHAPDRGTVESGKVADLVLLNDNPLSDIQNASKIEAVIYRGKVLTKTEIEKGLKTLEEKYGN